MNKQRSPIKAVYLNIILPGLGLAYLGKWGSAVMFFIWTPLRLLLRIAVIRIIPFSKLVGDWGLIIQAILIYGWWIVVIYDTCTTPYELAIESNHKIVRPAIEATESVNRRQ